MIIEQLIKSGRELELYQESEMADQDATENVLDYLWQSIYDVYHLVVVGIIEGEIDDLAMDEASDWLKQAKEYTQDYKDIEL